MNAKRNWKKESQFHLLSAPGVFAVKLLAGKYKFPRPYESPLTIWRTLPGPPVNKNSMLPGEEHPLGSEIWVMTFSLPDSYRFIIHSIRFLNFVGSKTLGYQKRCWENRIKDKF
jgi:hypothetical protein